MFEKQMAIKITIKNSITPHVLLPPSLIIGSVDIRSILYNIIDTWPGKSSPALLRKTKWTAGKSKLNHIFIAPTDSK